MTPDFTPLAPDHAESLPLPDGPGAEAAAHPVEASPKPHSGKGTQPASEKFPIVTLGGSAGSFEALERFFTHLTPHSGMAFVVVTHLPPSQPSELPAVLQRFTAMPVAEAEDGIKVRPNHVYVIPPDRDLSLLHGTLYLLQPTQAPNRRMPIDFFLQSLAKDARERGICVILSGLGADGSIGLKLVMENFGMVMVQDPATALFDSMPRAALATEFVDFVLAPELMPAKLLDYVDRPPLARPVREQEESAAKPAHALQKIFLLIRQQTGHDFSYYKRNTVFRRIERRMNSHQIKEFTAYVRYLQENPQEVEQLFRELLIGVTKFFRDQEAFESLKTHLRPVIQAKPTDGTIRVWAPGCSTGEEAYSLAMTLLELLDEVDNARYLKLQIFATDISAEGIDSARMGLYTENIMGDVSPERLRRFFHKTDGHYQIRKEVRDVVVYALHNINKDAPFTKLDLLCCRNLLIYLSAELQKNLMPVFHYAINPGGLLFLGPSENLTSFQDLFQPLDVKWKISRRTETASSLPRLVNFPFAMSRQHLPSPHPSVAMSTTITGRRDGGPFAAQVQKTLLATYAPPAVVINPKGEILYVHGRTGKYLEPAPGLSGMNLFDMAREDLSFELSGAVHRATQTRQSVVLDQVRVKTEGGQQLLRLTVKYLEEPDTLTGLLLVAFEDQPTPRKVRLGKGTPGSDLSRDAVVTALDKELQYTKHRLQTTIEEMESSLEELKSTNEELQSANEELQSTNEEAMTNKEEMQSLNEELMTLNMQYLAKTDELSQAANDMKNLLDATEIAIIFLDNSMNIKRFTPPVSRIVHLMPADVGRPLSHFAANLRYQHLLRDVQQVLDRLTSVETNIQATSGEWYTMRILPYRTLDNYINGAVITFTEVTGLKKLEAELQESVQMAASLKETVRQPVVVLNADLNVVFVNHSFAQIFGATMAELQGASLTVLASGALNQLPLLEPLRQLLTADPDDEAPEFDQLPLEVAQPAQPSRQMVFYGRRLLYEGQRTGRVLLGIERVEPLGPDSTRL
ncbi:two-component system CheB/CheR fusion protein [Hymenobacter luteus]|uniref:protein-glutamate O-methyltransferase n=2 Tax=Hymenobacter TaxID=89966 RepID=A0A7W9T5T0_9BACT|nr:MULTISPECIES: CheR family methyltransferase [Hymenobacter]MBB4603092.1 two-component system CheB/CheR fusion protein [Hymenobacter latericoloratus]MBB6060949.1 two-component system CheB/CheR fusion protein [Hymenobacter luteus]